MLEASVIQQLFVFSIVKPQLGGVNFDTGVAVGTEEFKSGIFQEPFQSFTQNLQKRYQKDKTPIEIVLLFCFFTYSTFMYKQNR